MYARELESLAVLDMEFAVQSATAYRAYMYVCTATRQCMGRHRCKGHGQSIAITVGRATKRLGWPSSIVCGGARTTSIGPCFNGAVLRCFADLSECCRQSWNYKVVSGCSCVTGLSMDDTIIKPGLDSCEKCLEILLSKGCSVEPRSYIFYM